MGQCAKSYAIISSINARDSQAWGERKMRVTFTVFLLLALAAIASGQQVQDASQLIGKKIVVQRMPLCEPGTYSTVIAYAGKTTVVLFGKPSKMFSFPMSQSVLEKMKPEVRAMVQDQQKAATVLVQFEDGKKLDTCAPIGPARISEYFELAEGETIAPPPVQPNTTPDSSHAVATETQAVEMLSDDEVKSALTGSGKDRLVRIDDAGLMAAQGALGTLPHITLSTPEALIAVRNEQARKQFLSYEPSEEDRKRSLTVFAQGYIGATYQEGCQSITRIVLLSSPSGGVAEEAYLSESGTEAWANGFGATNHCEWLRVKFSLATVRKVRAAAQDGEFYIAVFAGSRNTKTYKIKHKHQAKLALN